MCKHSNCLQHEIPCSSCDEKEDSNVCRSSWVNVLPWDRTRKWPFRGLGILDWQLLIWSTHWGRVTHTCVGKDSDNGLAPSRRQSIVCTYDGILLIGPLGTNFNEIVSEIQIFLLKKIRLKLSSAKCCLSSVGLRVNKRHRQWNNNTIMWNCKTSKFKNIFTPNFQN